MAALCLHFNEECVAACFSWGDRSGARRLTQLVPRGKSRVWDQTQPSRGQTERRRDSDAACHKDLNSRSLVLLRWIQPSHVGDVVSCQRTGPEVMLAGRWLHSDVLTLVLLSRCSCGEVNSGSTGVKPVHSLLMVEAQGNGCCRFVPDLSARNSPPA